MIMGYLLVFTLLGFNGSTGVYGTQAVCEAAGTKLPGAVKIAPVKTLPLSSTKSYYFCRPLIMPTL